MADLSNTTEMSKCLCYMCSADRVILSLLDYAVSKKNITLDNDIDWETVFHESVQQGVSGVLIDGIQSYMTDNPTYKIFSNKSTTDKQKRMQWLGQVMMYERLYVKHEKAMADLARLYATKDIQMMVD